MQATGHKILYLFLRYQIVDTRATARALREVQTHHAAAPKTDTGTDTARSKG